MSLSNEQIRGEGQGQVEEKKETPEYDSENELGVDDEESPTPPVER